jgi:hypothetical protein
MRERGRTMLVVEYVRGEPLDRLVGQPMEVGKFLRLAVALSAALEKREQRTEPECLNRTAAVKGLL